MRRLLLTLTLALPASAFAQATPASPLVNRDLIMGLYAQMDALEAQLNVCPGCQSPPVAPSPGPARPRTDGKRQKLEAELAAVKAQLAAKCLGATEPSTVQACLNNNRAGLDTMRGAQITGLMALAPQGRAGKVMYSVGATETTPGAVFTVDSTPSPEQGVLDAFRMSVQNPVEPASTFSRNGKIGLTTAAGCLLGAGTGYLVGKDAKYQNGEQVREATRLPYTLAIGAVGCAVGLGTGAFVF